MNILKHPAVFGDRVFYFDDALSWRDYSAMRFRGQGCILNAETGPHTKIDPGSSRIVINKPPLGKVALVLV